MAYPKRKCLISSGVPNELASAVRPMYSEEMISPVTSHSGPNQGATKEATNIKYTQRPRKPGLANTNVCKGPAMIKCWFVVAHVETVKIQKVHVGAKDAPIGSCFQIVAIRPFQSLPAFLGASYPEHIDSGH